MATSIGFESEVDGATILRFVIFDSAWEEVHSIQATPTTHPIEDGTQISDHVNIEPVKVNLQVRVVQNPLQRNFEAYGFALKDFSGTVGGVSVSRVQQQITHNYRKQRSQVGMSGGSAPYFRPPFFPGRATPVVATAAEYVDVPETVTFFSTVDNPNKRVQTVYKALRDVVLTGQQVRLITELQYYPQMVITAMSTPKEATDGLTFSLQLQTVKYAGTSEVATVKVKVKESRAKSKDSSAPGKVTLFAQPGQGASIAAGLAGGGKVQQ